MIKSGDSKVRFIIFPFKAIYILLKGIALLPYNIHRINKLKNNKKLYGQMSQCARKRFKEEFHVQHMTDKTEQLYKSIYEEKKKGRTAHVDSTNYGDKAAN